MPHQGCEDASWAWSSTMKIEDGASLLRSNAQNSPSQASTVHEP